MINHFMMNGTLLSASRSGLSNSHNPNSVATSTQPNLPLLKMGLMYLNSTHFGVLVKKKQIKMDAFYRSVKIHHINREVRTPFNKQNQNIELYTNLINPISQKGGWVVSH